MKFKLKVDDFGDFIPIKGCPIGEECCLSYTDVICGEARKINVNELWVDCTHNDSKKFIPASTILPSDGIAIDSIDGSNWMY